MSERVPTFGSECLYLGGRMDNIGNLGRKHFDIPGKPLLNVVPHHVDLVVNVQREICSRARSVRLSSLR